MSDKPNGQITLEELKAGCHPEKHNECLNGMCKYYKVCPYRNGIMPRDLDLTDPSRFTEAQMALGKGLLAVGCTTILRTNADSYRCLDKNGEFIFMLDAFEMKDGETLNLAELFGKEGA